MLNRHGEKDRLLVIGNGMAGIRCVEEILRLDPDRYHITVFGKEGHPNYNRVLLSSVLDGEKTLEDITLNDFNWYEKMGISLFAGCKVSEIKRGSRVVITEDGSEIAYNKLVLATGSLPFIPPIEGIKKEGVFTFRDINDCERIKSAAQGSKKAIVIGGGLLGLEAARGVMKLGIDVTVVHIVDRLMESQLDSTAAVLLREDIESMGVKVDLGRETTEILGEGKVEGVKFSDGKVCSAGMVILAAGIRPNIGLAKASGLYCERGILVSDTMQTYDPAIYALGECVQHRGTTFGLVAPIFEQARVLSNHLAGDSRLTFVNKPVSTRLKIPGIDLYSAGNVTSGNPDFIEYRDYTKRVYKRLFFSNGRIDGILLYGDTPDGPALFQHLLEGQDLSERRGELLLGDRMQKRVSASIESLPDNAVVCGCNGVTKGTIVESIKEKGLFTLDDVKRETKAATSCGGCGQMVEQILELILGSDFSSSTDLTKICDCTKYTRDDLIRNIREKELKSVGEVMEALGWETVGCDMCRPAINYYVSMVWPKEYEDDPTSRIVNERLHANIQKDGTYSVVPRMYGGVTDSDELRRIADVAERYDVPLIKLTGGQRIDLLGIRQDDLPKVWKDLRMHSGYAYGKALRTVKTCVGARFCRYGTQDSIALGIALEKKYEGLWTPAKVKVGVSGCPRNCAESSIKDVGVVGIVGGWEIYVAGCGGTGTRAGDLLCSVSNDKEVMDVVSAFLQYYREEANYGERTSNFIDRTGLDIVRMSVVEEAEKRRSLVCRLEESLESFTDPWEEKVCKMERSISRLHG